MYYINAVYGELIQRHGELTQRHGELIQRHWLINSAMVNQYSAMVN